MRPKRLAPWLAVLGALVWAGAARAQSQWSSDYFYYAPFYCESYLVYDPTYQVISGYSRTFDYENEGYQVGVQAYFYDPNNIEYYNEDMGEYEEAEADVSGGGFMGNYWLYGDHWGVGADWGCCEYYLGESQTNLYEDEAISSVNLGGQPWQGGGTYNITITGGGFSGASVALSGSGLFSSSSFTVVSDSEIDGSVQISPSVNYGNAWVYIFISARNGVMMAQAYVATAPAPPPPPPTVTIQVEAAKQASGNNAFVLTGTDQSTTNLTGTGSPSGGTYSWTPGPGLAFQGPSTGQNVTIVGTIPSTSQNDTWVQVGCTVNGSTGYASIRATVRVPAEMVSYSNGGPTKTTVISGASSGYYTNITYWVYDQDALGNQNIEVAGINATEGLQTVSTSSNSVEFTPPDNSPLSVPTNSAGQIFDSLYAVAPGGLPTSPAFSAVRTQNFTLSGYAMSPANTQTFGLTYATISNLAFSH